MEGWQDIEEEGWKVGGVEEWQDREEEGWKVGGVEEWQDRKGSLNFLRM